MSSKMINVASGFQYSVNIGYDIGSDDKLKNFIPTQSALSLLEEILLSMNPTSTERARVLIGAYGKGKSHIILMILSILMRRNRDLFEKTMPKIDENPRLKQLVEYYYDLDNNKNKILPIIITGSNTSVSQAFLMALQRTLSINGLDVMPETNYKAAVQVIERWKNEFPKTYEKFRKSIDLPVKKFIDELLNYNNKAYETFERIYTSLTSGSVFNPFVGFDVVDLYEEALKGLRKKGYTGIYVIYDEFSKYLEANITEASVSDTKMLQDFAEMCNRSGELQMHIMLISHKEISNYIDKLPKNKVDGWRGVSERFKHIHLSNNYTQTYEIIGAAIQKEKKYWNPFKKKNKEYFTDVLTRYKKHPVFNDVDSSEIEKTVYECYPLHPVSTFILPRLSERIAQNERTLFTFLSSPESSTLMSFLKKYNDDHFQLLTPDLIYDYFEPLFKKEVYDESIHDIYYITALILEKLEEGSIENKIVKTLSLIYILEQFDKIQPSKDEIIGIFSIGYTPEEITNALNNLIEKEYVIYLKRSNNFLRLKQTSGVDVHQKIRDLIEIQRKNVTVKSTLNNSNFDSYMYPARYNNQHDMIRYFAFEFIDESEVTDDVNWEVKGATNDADGIIYGIIPHSKRGISRIRNTLEKTTTNLDRFIFVVPRNYHDIEEVVREFNAVASLRDDASDDKVLYEEYDVIYEDLHEVIGAFIRGYTKPEDYRAMYYYRGKDLEIKRKSALSEQMSVICDVIYSHTPIINNEAINKNEITSIAGNSRNKIVTALLRNELESNLGLTGSSQEVSIMRSTLIRTGILEESSGVPTLNLKPNKVRYMDYLLRTIEEFILSARKGKGKSFADLYNKLQSPNGHIGLRKGVIPIYLAVVMHNYKKEIVVSDQFGQVPLSADVLSQINAKPELFNLSYLDWDSDKEKYINKLELLFSEFVIEEEKKTNSYDYVASAMRRWYMALPKYAKESRLKPDNDRICKEFIDFLRLLKINCSGNELLFQKLPKVFDASGSALIKCIKGAKAFYDSYLLECSNVLADLVKDTFAPAMSKKKIKMMSLSSVIKDWCDSLVPSVFDQLFADGTDRVLELFKNVTNDDYQTITGLAKIVTDLRLDDWDDRMKDVFLQNLMSCKRTAEQFIDVGNEKQDVVLETTYQISYVDENGNSVTKRFDRVEDTKWGKLLHNQVTAALEGMGRAMTDQEKRQVLMEIMKKLC